MSGIGWPGVDVAALDRGLGWPSGDPRRVSSAGNGGGVGSGAPPTGAASRAAREGAVWWEALQPEESDGGRDLNGDDGRRASRVDPDVVVAVTQRSEVSGAAPTDAASFATRRAEARQLRFRDESVRRYGIAGDSRPAPTGTTGTGGASGHPAEWGGGMAPAPGLVGELVGASERVADTGPEPTFHVEPGQQRGPVEPPFHVEHADDAQGEHPGQAREAPGVSFLMEPPAAGAPSAPATRSPDDQIDLAVAGGATGSVGRGQRPTLASLLTTGHRPPDESAPDHSVPEQTAPGGEAIPWQGAVSRETAPGASEPAVHSREHAAWEDRDAERATAFESTDVPDAPREQLPTRQTSPAEPLATGEPGPMDGSAGMHEQTGGPGSGVATAASWMPDEPMDERARAAVSAANPDIQVSYNELERVDLAQSLPSFDETTPLAVEVAEDARRRITLSGRPFPRPPRTRILTVANQKGGVGKTTTTVNIAAALAQAGLNVLVLDIDPQGNASTALGIDHHSEIPSLYDVVVEGLPLGDVLQACPDVPNLWCAPATIDLAGAEIELVSLVARETRLQRALTTYLDERQANGEPQIDYVFVDCPPSLSLLTVNAFVAAREVLIPIQCEYYALEGLSQLLKHVELIRGHLNTTLHVSTILLTMYDGRTRLSAQVADEVREHFPDQVVKTSVPRSVRISEAPSHGQTVMTYDPASSGALSYLEAARELAEQVLTWTDLTKTEERV